MIRKRAQLLLLNPTKRAPVIAALLLACLAWGATAELNHHHGVGSTNLSQQLIQSEASGTTDETPAPQFESSGQQGSSSTSRTGSECLICQLHQNLAATLFSHPPRVGTEEATALRAPTTVIVELNEFRPNQQGRAPPSLL